MICDPFKGKLPFALWGILGFALAVRLAWGLSRPADEASFLALPDQVEYLSLARNLLQGRGLGFVDPRFGQWVVAFRMPGYPAFVAACGGRPRIVRGVQAFIDASTVLAVFLMARSLFSERKARAAWIAAGIVAAHPLLIYFSGLILSETLFVSMLAWGMALLVAGAAADSARRRGVLRVAGGMLIALDVLVRPSAAPLAAMLAVASLFLNRRTATAYHPPLTTLPSHSAAESANTGSVSFGQAIATAATMLLLVVLVLAPWAVRNRRILHRMIWTDTNLGITLYDGYNPNAAGASDQRFVLKMPELAKMDEVGRSKWLASRAVAYIRHHPWRALKLAAVKIARTWSPLPLSDQFGRPLYRLVLLTYALPLDVLIVVGICQRKLRNSAILFLVLPAVYLTAVHALTIGSLRYRLPAAPALAIVAASVFLRRLPASAAEGIAKPRLRF